jgi:hypothetical protein
VDQPHINPKMPQAHCKVELKVNSIIQVYNSSQKNDKVSKSSKSGRVVFSCPIVLDDRAAAGNELTNFFTHF